MALKGDIPARNSVVARPVGRRAALRLGVAGVTMALSGPALSATLNMGSERTLAFRNLHTDEVVRATYWRDGRLKLDGLREINYILRDFRTGEIADIDVKLLNLLYRLAGDLGSGEPFEIISGYRSPKTNAQLANQSSGVAKRSLHMEGKAVDIRVPGVRLSYLRRAAMSLQAGGVGYYRKSGFVHVDTGRVRFW
jgi:uncharacterized protein YcbK (DUF882 family)